MGRIATYKSILTRDALAYNIAHCLVNLKEGENPYSLIENILKTFEIVKEDSGKESKNIL